MAKEKVDLQKFISDPAFAEDRAFLGGFIEHFLTEKAKEAKKREDDESAKNPPTIFDRLFGGM